MVPEQPPRPVRIGESFGWFHAATGARAPVLLCPPFGIEALASHIGWRSLAKHLAAQGHDVLRLDYPGTGHSGGEMLDPDRLAVWQASVGAAIDALKRATGASSVVLVGLRLGATLAALAAQGRSDIAGLVLMAPLVSGRRHVREIKALAQMQGASGHSEAGITLYGFEIAQATLNALGTLDLSSLSPPVPQGLVVARQESEEVLGHAWGFETTVFEGYEAFTENPTRGRAPEAVFSQLLAWCAALPQPAPFVQATPLQPARFELVGGIAEEAVLFGEGNRLFGVLSQPSGTASRVGVILANAGRNPAAGWGRQGVELARALAHAGHRALLFDASGIGDSDPAPDSPDEVLYAPCQEDDLLAAAALLRARGATTIFVIGACSGAYSALHAAPRLQGLGGLAMINLLRFHWQPGESLDVVSAQNAFRPTQAYGKRLFRRETWERLLQGEIALGAIATTLMRRAWGRLKRPVVRLLALCGLAHSRELEALSWFEALAARKVRVMMIHSQEDPGLVELDAYFGPEGRSLDAFPLLSQHRIDGGDHSLSSVSGRADLRALLVKAANDMARTASA